MIADGSGRGTIRDDEQGCTITRGPGNDVIRGTPGNDVICAGSGNDVVYAHGGNDVVYGGAGDDHLRGSEGDDRLGGGPGRDVLYGNAGADWLNTEDGRRATTSPAAVRLWPRSRCPGARRKPTRRSRSLPGRRVRCVRCPRECCRSERRREDGCCDPRRVRRND